MNHPGIILLLARGRQWVIGDGDSIAVCACPRSERFKAHDHGKPMIMGRKTFDRLPPVARRQPIVLTRDKAWEGDGANVRTRRKSP